MPQTHPAGCGGRGRLRRSVDRAGRGEDQGVLCSRCGCRTRARRSTGRTRPRSQEAFLDGHVYAFEQLGGIPIGQIRYDNLKAAVSRVLFGRTRVESDRWVMFRSHYGFDVFYCRPGVGGRPREGRRRGRGRPVPPHPLVPMPQVDSIAELNAYLARCDAEDDHRRIGNRIDDASATTSPSNAPLLRAVAGRAVRDRAQPDAHGWTGYARVTVRQCQYSVPARYIGRQVRVLLRATEVLVFDGPRLVAEHERCHRQGRRSPGPGPLPGGAGPQARRAARRDRPGAGPRRPGCSPPTHEAFWAAARKAATATRPAPRPWSRSCCCTAPTPAARSSPASAPPSRSGALSRRSGRRRGPPRRRNATPAATGSRLRAGWSADRAAGSPTCRPTPGPLPTTSTAYDDRCSTGGDPT